MRGYFDLLTDMCAKVQTACTIYENTLKAYAFSDKDVSLKKISDIRKSVFTQHKEICTKLKDEFLPPIEREDICILSQSCLKNIRMTENALEALIIYGIKETKKELASIAGVMKDMAKRATAITAQFKSRDKTGNILHLAEEMRIIFLNAKHKRSHAVRMLFKENSYPLMSAIWIKIFDINFLCALSFLEFAERAENIALKNA